MLNVEYKEKNCYNIDNYQEIVFEEKIDNVLRMFVNRMKGSKIKSQKNNKNEEKYSKSKILCKFM